jgi:hypothetical protein
MWGRRVKLHVAKAVELVLGVVNVSTDAHEDDGTISSVDSEDTVVELRDGQYAGMIYLTKMPRYGLTLSVKLADAG